MYLSSLRQEDFHQAIPKLPMGKYAHLIVLRETNSYPLFQTDGELNTAYVGGGLQTNRDHICRLVMFKRKQTTAERQHGRELLRHYGVLLAEPKSGWEKGKIDTVMPYYCEYNSKYFCKVCPDCTYYGYAIGDAGSERSKVLSDSAYSLTAYDVSHQSFTFNAPYENGTMSQAGKTSSLIGEQDHVLPQVFFPSVITIKDPTEAEFIYVLNNILHTPRYGAQTTRTGTVENHLVAAVFAESEIFSNLKLTQAIYDDATLKASEAQLGKPLVTNAVLIATQGAISSLLIDEGIATHQVDGPALRREMNDLTRDPQQMRRVLTQAAQESFNYAKAYGVLSKSKDDPNGGVGGKRGKQAANKAEGEQLPL